MKTLLRINAKVSEFHKKEYPVKESIYLRGGCQKMFDCGIFFQSWWARDNTAATTWPCFQATQLLVLNSYSLSIFVQLIHLYTILLTFFEFCLVPQALLRCRDVVASKLKIDACPALGFFIIRTHLGPLFAGSKFKIGLDILPKVSPVSMSSERA